MNAAAVPIENSAWNRDGVQLIKVQTGRKVTDLFNSGPLRFADLGRNHPAGEENLRRIASVKILQQCAQPSLQASPSTGSDRAESSKLSYVKCMSGSTDPRLMLTLNFSRMTLISEINESGVGEVDPMPDETF